MADFNVSRNRDASSAILGFCYQVDCTIARWLALEVHQSLELERGEDIDIVAKSLLDSSDTNGRQLEQVKHLSRRISLRNREVLSFIANAVEHRSANPAQSLIFRFVTNAEVGSERPAAFDDRASAIRVWDSIRLDRLSDTERVARLAGLRAFLQTTKRPKDLPDKTWAACLDFFKSSDDPALSDFIKAIEWSVSNPNAAGMQSKVREMLQEYGFSSDSAHAEELHGRLFLYTLRLLTQSGRKCLSRADLIRQASSSPLSDSERQFLRAVSAHVTVLDSRVDTLEALIREQQTTVLAPLVAQVQLLAAAENLPADLAPTQPKIDTACPPKIRQLCQRQAIVGSLSQQCGDKACLWLHGGIGTGKTQLGLLLLEKLGLEPVWLALRDLTVPLAIATVQHGLRQTSETPIGSSLQAIIEAIKVRGRTAIVLDDLPAIVPGSALAKLTLDLAQSGQECGVLVIVLTHHPQPCEFQELASGKIIDCVVPPFSVDEAAELFSRRGASPTFSNDGAIETLNAIAGGHPWMLVAMARFFESRGWRIDSEGLDAVGRFAHADSVLNDVVRRVIATVEDIDSRNLLYRLGLTVSPFRSDTVQAVALVNPVLDRPRERLTALSGLWLDQRSDTTMAVCPLIRPLAESELLPEVRHAVLLRLGDEVLNQSQHSIADLSSALNYFSSAGAFNRAALLLIVALKGSSRLPRELAGQLLALSKVPSPIAPQIATELRIYLEGERIRLASRLGRPIEKVLRRLLGRCNRATKGSAWAVFSSALTLAPKAAKVDFALGLEFIQLACKTYRHVRAPLSRKRVRIARFRPEYLLWQVVPYILSASDLSAWLDVLEGMPEIQRRRTLEWPDAEEGVRIAVSRVWMKEFERPQRERNWQRVLEFYERLAGRAQQMGVESISAEAVASQVVVLADYMKNLPAAIRTAEEALVRSGLSDLSQYRIIDSLGRQFVYHRQFSQAIEWLERGFVLAGDHFPVHRTWSYLELARAVGETDRSSAVATIQKAVDLARNHPRAVGTMSLSLALGELAIAQWKAGDLKKCFEAFNEAIEHFWACKDKSVDWQQRFACFGHAASFFATLTNTGKPPECARDGSPFAPPYQGFFMSFDLRRIEMYEEEQTPLIFSLMAYFAQGVGDDERAGDWGLKGIDYARETGNLVGMQQLNSHSFSALLATDKYIDALDAAVECCHATIALMERHKRGESTLVSRLSIRDELGAKPNALWSFAEHQSITYGVIPLTMQLASHAGSEMHESLADILDLLHRYASLASDPNGWSGVITMLRAIFVVPIPSRELMRIANEAGRNDQSQLHMLGYLGVSLLADTSVEAAAICQAMVLAYLAPQFEIEPSTYRRIVLPFVCAYWKKVLEEQKFRFTAPAEVISAFDQAIVEPSTMRAQAVFKAILSGLRVPLSKHTQIANWLKTDG